MSPASTTANPLSGPLVSIVVRMFNEAAHLDKLFSELGKQTYPHFEIVAVDSGSNDGSLEMARRACDQVVQIRSEDFTFGYSLNQGIEKAQGELIAIVSAHTYPTSNRWLESMVNALLSDPNHALAYGKQVGVQETKLSESFEFSLLFDDQPRVQKAPQYFCNNANSLIRKDLWSLHPFDETLTGLEDQAWSKYWMDQGKTIVYVPEAGIHHIHNETEKQIENRYYREAVAARHIGILDKSQLPTEVLKLTGRYFSDLGKLVTQGKLHPKYFREVTHYRLRQTKGHVRGILHDVQKQETHDLYFPEKNPAVVIRGPRSAELSSIPMPILKPGDVLIRVATVGICSTDLEVYRGTLGYFESGLSTYPIVPGHEYCGTIVAVGAKVGAHLQPGTQVVGECILTCMKCEACLSGRTIACTARREVGVMRYNGAYASFVALPASFVHPVPAEQDIRKYAIVEPLAVCHKAIHRLHPTKRIRKVAIFGAGPIGNLCAQLLLQDHHEITVFDPNAKRLSYLQALSVQTEQNHATQGKKNELQLERFDTIVETTGKKEVLETILKESAPDSELLLIGFPYGEIPFQFETLVAYDRRIVGSVGSTSEDFKAAIRLVPTLSLDPFFERVLPISDYEKAWHDHESQKYLKVMLTHESEKSESGTSHKPV